MEVINSDGLNTVKSLRDKLLDAVSEGIIDGFPLVTSTKKLVGYIGTNELEHALCTSVSSSELFDTHGADMKLDNPDVKQLKSLTTRMPWFTSIPSVTRRGRSTIGHRPPLSVTLSCEIPLISRFTWTGYEPIPPSLQTRPSTDLAIARRLP